MEGPSAADSEALRGQATNRRCNVTTQRPSAASKPPSGQAAITRGEAPSKGRHMELPSCRGCPVFHDCNETTGCIHPDAKGAVPYEKYATAIAAVEAAEQHLMEWVCRLQAATNNHNAFSEGSEWRIAAGKRMMQASIEVRKARKAYAQAVLDAYASGMTRNGQILWS